MTGRGPHPGRVAGAVLVVPLCLVAGCRHDGRDLRDPTAPLPEPTTTTTMAPPPPPSFNGSTVDLPAP